MLSTSLLAAMNDQIKHELYSSYLYLAIAAHFEEANWPGFAHWMKIQASEEQGHALKFYEHIHDRGGVVTLQAIDQPPSQFGGPTAIFQSVLEHEQKVTGLINNLYHIAHKENDFASQAFLTWFVTEQVEEEKNATQILEWLKKAGENTNALFQINGVLQRRGE